MSELDKVAPGGVVQLHDAPGSLDDEAFDSMFPAEPRQLQTPVQQTVVQPAGTTPQSQTQEQIDAQNQYYLKADKTVYKTADEAIKGINHKDEIIARDKATIEQLRQRYVLTTGIDPITGQPVGQPQQTNAQSLDYSRNPDKYLDDLAKAAQGGKPSDYAQVQGKFIDDRLAPLAPLIAQVARQQAITEASKINPEIGKFVGTEQYDKTMQYNPDLANAIATAEQNSQFHSRLPGLYKLAH